MYVQGLRGNTLALLYAVSKASDETAGEETVTYADCHHEGVTFKEQRGQAQAVCVAEQEARACSERVVPCSRGVCGQGPVE